MWLFTKHGFFSAVCARQDDGGRGRAVDPDRVMVRARQRAHLEALACAFPDLLADTEIHCSANTDYAYRLFVPKDCFTRLAAALAEELDYDNFKSEAARHLGSSGGAYEHALHDVWLVMYKLQKAEGRT